MKMGDAKTENLNEKLDRLKDLIQEPDFIEGKGLSNEVNIRVFCYEPEDEMIVRHFLNQLIADHSLACRLKVQELYQIFLSICEDMGISEGIQELEKSDGSEYLLSQLRTTITEQDFISKMQYEPHQKGDVIVLTGVGDVFPFMRVHSLLEAMQKDFSDVPILVMYPGTFDGRSLQLFDRLTPNDYYRAFNII